MARASSKNVGPSIQRSFADLKDLMPLMPTLPRELVPDVLPVFETGPLISLLPEIVFGITVKLTEPNHAGQRHHAGAWVTPAL